MASEPRYSASIDLTAALEEATRELKSERARYFELFDLAPTAYAVTDSGGVLRELNKAFADLMGAPRDRLLGKPLTTFVPLPDRRAFRDQLSATNAHLGRRTWESPLETRAKRRLVEFTVTPSIAGPRVLEDLRWTFHDVTARARAEEEIRDFAAELEARVGERTAELEAQRARLEAVVANIPAGLVIVDPERRVLLANDQARAILGAEGTVSDAAVEAYGPEGRRYETGDFPIERTLRSGEVVRNERIAITRVDGSDVVIDVSTAPVYDSAGVTVGALSLFHDVTALERQERAEREFVTNAAHELQSPLAGILGAIEVLQSGAKEGPDREVFLGHIEREANRLARLARALLILARAQTGYEAPKNELIALEPLLTHIASALRPVPGVDVEVRCAPTLAAVTNRELVEQALVNVAENAAKYTTAGGIALTAHLDGETAEITITDTGPGIPDDERSNVLDRFYRAARNGSEGFGLGFAIVRSAVSALEGQLELESKVGVGTSVTIRLPRGATLVEP